MNLGQYFSVKPRGEKAKMAKAIKAHHSDFVRWVSGARPIPAKFCILIEKETKYQVSRQELRPFDYWLIWPDLEPPRINAASVKNFIEVSNHG